MLYLLFKWILDEAIYLAKGIIIIFPKHYTIMIESISPLQ